MSKNIYENENIKDDENENFIKFDAFTYGIEKGGLRSKAQINIMVCYIVANVNARVTAKNIVDAMVTGSIANYFEVSEAVAGAIKRGLVVEDEEGFLTATKECKKLTELVENDLPYTMRVKSIELTLKTATVDRFTKENKVEIEKTETGSYNITMHITDKDIDFLVLTLNVPSIAEAEVIREKFLNDPVKVYDNLMNTLFDEN